MESTSFGNLIPKLLSNSNINEVDKDGDFKTTVIIKDSKWNVLIREDVNQKILNIRYSLGKMKSVMQWKVNWIKKKVLIYSNSSNSCLLHNVYSFG